MNKKRFVGFILILVGMLSSFSRIVLTGAVIGESNYTIISILSSSMVIGGIILILAEERTEERGLERRIVRTERFEKSIRKYHNRLGDINRAIEKIGSGKGNEEYVRQVEGYSIRVGKGDRLIFDKKKDGSIALREYLPPSRHY